MQNTFRTQLQSAGVLFTTQDRFTKKQNHVCIKFQCASTVCVELVPTGKTKFYEGLQASNFKGLVKTAGLCKICTEHGAENLNTLDALLTTLEKVWHEHNTTECPIPAFYCVLKCTMVTHYPTLSTTWKTTANEQLIVCAGIYLTSTQLSRLQWTMVINNRNQTGNYIFECGGEWKGTPSTTSRGFANTYLILSEENTSALNF